MEVCSIGQHIKKPEIAGFYLQDDWYSPFCKINRFPNISRVRDCFEKKQIYILGDSTIRQLFSYYLDNLHLKRRIEGIQQNVFTGPILGENETHDLSICFAFHGMPINRNSPTYAADIHYIANRIDNIPNNTSPVVVISVWAHFTSASTWFYEDRVQGIVSAMERLLGRNPDARVIFKGANTRAHGGFGELSSCSDWYARDLEDRMRKIVFQHERIGFLDTWDMTNAQLNPDNVHPTGTHVPNLSDQLLTLLGCQP